jgi:uncharacterized protein (TIGR00288 family)
MDPLYNFYYKLKDIGLHRLLDFNFSGFASFLISKSNLVCSVYRVGEVRTDGTEKVQKLYDNQQKLIARLKKHKYQYCFGYLLKSDGKFHKKGVDVQLAVDILVGAYEKLYDRIILVSSDTDLIPAIEKAKENGVTIEYVGFSHKPSVAMVRHCSESTLLKREEVLPFLS